MSLLYFICCGIQSCIIDGGEICKEIRRDAINIQRHPMKMTVDTDIKKRSRVSKYCSSRIFERSTTFNYILVVKKCMEEKKLSRADCNAMSS